MLTKIIYALVKFRAAQEIITKDDQTGRFGSLVFAHIFILFTTLSITINLFIQLYYSLNAHGLLVLEFPIALVIAICSQVWISRSGQIEIIREEMKNEHSDVIRKYYRQGQALYLGTIALFAFILLMFAVLF